MRNFICRAALLCIIVTAMMTALAACGSTSREIAASGQWTDGTYLAVAEGRNGNFEVTVTIEDGVMVSVEVGENEETEEKGGAAIEALLPAFISEQTFDVDTISGATVTSSALKDAVGECLAEASQEALAETDE